MGKRAATSKITKDTPEVTSSEEETEKTSAVDKLDTRGVAGRKISKPVKRIPRDSKPVASNPFAMLAESSNANPLKPIATPASDDSKLELLRQMKGLNRSFSQSLRTKLEAEPATELSSLFQQYGEHLKQIKAKHSPSTVAPTTQQPQLTLPSIETSPALSKVAPQPFKFGAGGSFNTFSETPKPFAFGVPAKPEDPKSLVPTNPTLESKDSSGMPKPFDFGSAPVFSSTVPTLGSASEPGKGVEEKKPQQAFSFGGFTSMSSSAVPALGHSLFGASVPLHTLNPNAAPFTSTGCSTVPPVTDLPEGPKPFSFSFGTPLPSFGGFSTPAVPFSPPNGATAENEDEDAIPVGEEESFSGNRSNSELIKTGAGEEDETNRLEQRCKLFILEKDSGWNDLGIAILKVNQGKEGKSRILARAEGSGRILLNAWINANTVAEHAEGRKDLTILCVNQDAKLAKYLIRCKESGQSKQIADEITTISLSGKAQS